jgi:integrase
MKEKLTDKYIKGLKPKDTPYDAMDTLAGFGVRVLPSGHKSFMLYRIFPNSSGKAARRSLGAYGAFSAAEIERRKQERAATDANLPLGSIMSLAEARELAHTCLVEISRGKDPWCEAKRAKEAAAVAERAVADRLVSKVLDDFVKHKRHVRKLRSIDATAAELGRELKPWFNRDITEIGEGDVRALINRILRRGRHGQARAILVQVKIFFGWAVRQRTYGLKFSPAAVLKGEEATDLVGVSEPRNRYLRDYEIRALWRAAETMAYPFGKLYQLLTLTALRRDEAALATWNEIDFDKRTWIIPASRMKLKRDFYVPLSDDVIELLQSLPRGTGPYLFSTSLGNVPVGGFSQAKKRLDEIMKRELEAEGLSFFEDKGFQIRDLRRTCRTNYSGLAGVSEAVAEALLDHVPTGMAKVYNLWTYQNEKRVALEKWHEKLKLIVEPQSNVVPFERASA